MTGPDPYDHDQRPPRATEPTRMHPGLRTTPMQAAPAVPPDFMVIGAFRYALDRMTYAVGETVGWLSLNWSKLPQPVAALIRKELAAAIRRDDHARTVNPAAGADRVCVLPLGMDMDRAEWLKLARVAGIAP